MVITADTHTPLELEEIWDSHEEPSATSMLPTIVVYVLAHQCFPLALYIKCHANASRERCTCSSTLALCDAIVLCMCKKRKRTRTSEAKLLCVRRKATLLWTYKVITRANQEHRHSGVMPCANQCWGSCTPTMTTAHYFVQTTLASTSLTVQRCKIEQHRHKLPIYLYSSKPHTWPMHCLH